MDKKNLKEATIKLLNAYEQKIKTFSESDFLKSDIDPFRFGFNTQIWGIKAAIKKEIEHKIEMALEDLFGDFHENYLGNATHEPSQTKWEKIPNGKMSGVDIANKKKRWYLQIKSKHNSMNSSSAKRLAQELEEQSKKNPRSKIGAGWVIAKPNRKCIGEKEIAAVCDIYKGRELFKFVTGNPKEMDKVVTVFPKVVKEAIQGRDLEGLIDDAAKRVLDSLTKLAEEQKSTIVEYLYKKAIE